MPSTTPEREPAKGSRWLHPVNLPDPNLPGNKDGWDKLMADLQNMEYVPMTRRQRWAEKIDDFQDMVVKFLNWLASRVSD